MERDAPWEDLARWARLAALLRDPTWDGVWTESKGLAVVSELRVTLP